MAVPPDELRLKQYLLQLPEVYGFKHEQIREMRRDLRVTLLRELAGAYAPMLFGNEPIESRAFLPPREWLPKPDGCTHSHHGRPCALKLGRGEPTHRCLTCGLDDTCVLCKYCYNPADHVGHNVFVKISIRDDGGICDCGDAEAWTREVHCLADHGPQGSEPIPDGFAYTARRVLNVALDFVVDVLSGASLAAQHVVTEEQIERISAAARLNPASYGTQHDLPAGVRWCLLLWDDDKRSPTDLRVNVQLATERSDEFARMILNQVRTVGRATIAVSPEFADLTCVRAKIKHFTTSIRSIRDVMREEMVAEILQLALDLTKCRIDGAEAEALTKLVGEALLADWRPGVDARDPSLAIEAAPSTNTEIWSLSDLIGVHIPTDEDRETVNTLTGGFDDDDEDMHDDVETPATADDDQAGAVKLYARLAEQLSKDLDTDVKPNWPLRTRPSRVKHLIFYDIRLYKALRQTLTDLYVAALMSDAKLKMDLACVYADLYPLLVEQYMNIDREPDLSVTTVLSTQLFTTPSVATNLMHTDAFYVYCKMLRNLVAKKGKLDPVVFRNRRIGQVFHELGYLLFRNTEKMSVGGDPARIAQTANFLSLFQGMAPMKRQADKHVEYESERWVYCFVNAPYALQLARGVASGVHECDAPPIEGIRAVATALTHWEETLETDIGIASGLDGPRRVIVEQDPVSMLHTVHSFLSWLIEFSGFHDLESLRYSLNIQSLDKLGLFDAPIRTLALVSQISVGLWVRNGYVMRIQLQWFREGALRDLAYAREVFLSQVALCVLNPNHVFQDMLQRFGINAWPDETLGDEHQKIYLLEEFLHCCTALLCDRLRFQGLESNELRRVMLAREIVQVLGFGAMPYSDITRLVPENMVLDELFDMILAECADFTPPRGAHDIGMYTLKPELFEQFDPQYTYFTLARTEEAERIMQTRNGNPNHTVPLLQLAGPWSRLGMFTISRSFAAFMHKIVSGALKLETAQAEQVLGRALYLLIVAAKHDNMRKERLREEDCYESLRELLFDLPIADTLLQIYRTSELRAVHMRIIHLFELLHEADPSVPVILPNDAESKNEADKQLRRKEKGRAMQKKILDDFSRQQKEFMMRQEDYHSAEYDDDEVEMDSSTEEYVFPKQCILCRVPDDAESIFGIMTYTSETCVQRDIPLDDPYWVEQSFSEDPSLDIEHPLSAAVPEGTDGALWGPPFPRDHTHKSTVVHGCGHGVHYRCYREFLEQQQVHRSPLRFLPENPRKREFLCPLCRGLNNCFMPVLWATNSLDVETFLAEAEDAIANMNSALSDEPRSENLRAVVASGLSTLSDRFLYAIEHQDFSESLPSNVRIVLLEQMLKIKEVCEADSAEVYGLRTVYRCLYSTVCQTEVELRGQKHSTPFGGLVIDQLSTRTTQFLRVFAKYVTTLTGFIMSSSMQLQAEPVKLGLVPILARSDPCKVVEMLVFGAPVYGLQPITVLRAGLVSRLISALISVQKLDLSRLPKDLPPVDPELAAEISKWTNCDPRVVYSVLRYQATVTVRRAAILIFAMCGRYDPDDYAGIMHLPEHDRLMSYLQLPPLETFLKNFGRETPEGFAARRFARDTYASQQLRIQLDYPSVYRLLKLPNRLDTMFHVPGTTVPMDPALCLFCGYMCSIQETDDGESTGPCNKHLPDCVGSEGIFLLPRRNYVLLLLPDGRGTFIPAPYLDLHGEQDESMRRGRPHYLQPLRYDTMAREIWLQNRLPSTIARRLDQNQDNGGWETL